MWKVLILPFVIAGFMSACKKSDDSITPQMKYTTVQVVDYQTGDPIEGAVVNLVGDNAEVLESATTNSEGICQVTAKDFEMKYKNITKENYFNCTTPRDVFDNYIFGMELIGKLKLRLVAANSYPADAHMRIDIGGERFLFDGVFAADFKGMNDYPFPNTDSTIIIDAYAGQINRIFYSIVDSNNTTFYGSGGPDSVRVPRSGLGELEIHY